MRLKYILISCSLLFTALIISACRNDNSMQSTQSNQIHSTPLTSMITTVLIPAGTFRMGNTGAYVGNPDEKPVHSVTITNSYYMGKYAITQSQWNAIMTNNPSLFIGDSLPVETVNWLDAVRFCNKLSDKDGLQECYNYSDTNNVQWNIKANGWRLPTEAEWEYACKAGTQTDFYTGNCMFPSYEPVDPNLDMAGWYAGNMKTNSTYPVGLKQPNTFGLYDMHGNVFQWCWDVYDSYQTGNLTDPIGPVATSSSRRVSRGGCWDSNADVCRSSNRSLSSTCTMVGLCYVSFGLRVARNN